MILKLFKSEKPFVFFSIGFLAGSFERAAASSVCILDSFFS